MHVVLFGSPALQGQMCCSPRTWWALWEVTVTLFVFSFSCHSGFCDSEVRPVAVRPFLNSCFSQDWWVCPMHRRLKVSSSKVWICFHKPLIRSSEVLPRECNILEKQCLGWYIVALSSLLLQCLAHRYPGVCLFFAWQRWILEHKMVKLEQGAWELGRAARWKYEIVALRKTAVCCTEEQSIPCE